MYTDPLFNHSSPVAMPRVLPCGRCSKKTAFITARGPFLPEKDADGRHGNGTRNLDERYVDVLLTELGLADDKVR